jgi:hypothetical protein
MRNIMYLKNNSHHQIHGKGKVAIWLMINDVKIIQKIYNFPVLCHNVISMKQLVVGYIVTFSKQHVILDNVEEWALSFKVY